MTDQPTSDQRAFQAQFDNTDEKETAKQTEKRLRPTTESLEVIEKLNPQNSIDRCRIERFHKERGDKPFSQVIAAQAEARLQPTPRTDQVELDMMDDFARTLERELAAVTAERDKLTAQLNACIQVLTGVVFISKK